jgi:hypothetical protein
VKERTCGWRAAAARVGRLQVGLGDGVGVQQDEPAACAEPRRLVPRPGEAEVGGIRHQPHRRKSRGDGGVAAVGRGVVDDQGLEIAEGLRLKAFQAGAQRRAGVVGDHADGDRRRLVIAPALRHATASLPNRFEVP